MNTKWESGEKSDLHVTTYAQKMFTLPRTWRIASCRDVACRAVPCRILSWSSMSCRAVPCFAVSWHIISCHVDF